MKNGSERGTLHYIDLGPSRMLREEDGAEDIDFGIRRELTDEEWLQMRSTRKFILGLLDVNNYSEIEEIFNDPDKKARLYREFVEKISSMYGIEGPFEYKERIIKESLKSADSLISLYVDPQHGLFKDLSTEIAPNNKISRVGNPVDLLLIMFSGKMSKKMRFEARRKLILADLALRVHQRNEEMGDVLDVFNHILEEKVFSGGKVGSVEPVEAVTYHSPTDYACTQVNILEEGDTATTSAYRKYRRFGMREWKDSRGTTRNAMVEHRQKGTPQQMLKLMRKDTNNEMVIDDVLGYKITFMTKRDIFRFLETLSDTLSMEGYQIKYEDFYDTIENDSDFRITNPGSNNGLEIVKVHLIFQGKKIELQLHTIRTYVDAMHHDEKGFRTFELKRITKPIKPDNGEDGISVTDLLFPEDIYSDSIRRHIKIAAQRIREENRSRADEIPQHRRKETKKLLRYDTIELAHDVNKILFQMNGFIPDAVIAVKRSSSYPAQEIASALQARIYSLNTMNEDEVNRIAAAVEDLENILIVDDVGIACRHIAALKKKIPHAKTAVMVKKDRKESNALIDFWGREIKEDEWIKFDWVNDVETPHVYAIGLIYRRNTDGELEVLMQETERGLLKFPGGAKEEFDIDMQKAFMREVMEELSVKLEPGQVQHLHSAQYLHSTPVEYPQGFTSIFAAMIPEDAQITIKEDEMVGIRWMTLEQLTASQNKINPLSYQKMMIDWLNLLEDHHS